MGLAASQARFLQLTNRKSTIGRELQHLSIEKMDLTRDMQKITRNYQLALSKKSPKLTFNMGVTYSDISYNALMRPNENNSKSPIMVTNSLGRIIVDDKYKKYAEMISPNGAIGGMYSGETREKILQELTGVSPEKMQAFDSTAEEIQKTADAVEDALEARDKIKYEDYDADKFIKTFLSASNLGLSGNVGYDSNIGDVASKLKSAIFGKNYFSGEIENKISENFDEYIKDYKNQKKNVAVADFIKGFAGCIAAALDSGSKIHVMYDSKSKIGTQDKYEKADKAYKDAVSAYEEALSKNGQVYNAPEKTQIEYYDALFNSIVDNGWTYDGSVADSEYLSQMFQNNQFFVMTVEKNECFDPSKAESIRNYEYTYTTDLATNFNNIVFVNDSDAREEALVEYEYQKAKVNSKESNIDQRMTNLKTEEQAINKMLESIDKVKEDNIEGTFGLWA